MRSCIYILLIISLVSCEKEYGFKPELKPLNTVVVDALITNENKAQLVKLTYPLDSLNAQALPVSGAVVSVTDSINTYEFTELPKNSGNYFSQPFQAVMKKNYYLKIVFQGIEYTSIASMVALSTVDTFSFEAKNGLYKYVQFKTGEPRMVELTYDWSANALYVDSTGKKGAKEFLYLLNNVDVNKEFASAKEEILYPRETKIIRKRYSLSPDYQKFLRSFLIETEWSGGVFDVQKGNVITNISNGGLGYFAVCTVVADTLVVK